MRSVIRWALSTAMMRARLCSRSTTTPPVNVCPCSTETTCLPFRSSTVWLCGAHASVIFCRTDCPSTGCEMPPEEPPLTRPPLFPSMPSTTTPPVRTTTESSSGPLPPNMCNGHIDAISQIRNEVFIFKVDQLSTFRLHALITFRASTSGD